MQYFNPIQVARALNISDKTVRRHIQKGTITATRKASGELKIAEDQIEKLRLVLELESDPRQVYPGPPDMSRQVEALEAKVTALTAIVTSQEHRIVALESRHVPTESVPYTPTSATIPTYKPQNRNVARSEIPDDCILARDFARLHGVPESSFRRHIASGIAGESVHAGSSKHGRYLTPEQQELTLAFWRRHGVTFTE
jgi:hypothetical protein